MSRQNKMFETKNNNSEIQLIKNAMKYTKDKIMY